MNNPKDEIIRRQTNTIISLVVLVLFLLVTLLFLSLRSNSSSDAGECGVKEEPIVIGCGTNLLHGNDDETRHGSKLFKQNCAVCHATTDQLLTGPGLAGVSERVPQPAEGYLQKYILNYKKVIASGDGYATKLHSRFKDIEMTIFEDQLTPEEVKAIIAYINYAAQPIP